MSRLTEIYKQYEQIMKSEMTAADKDKQLADIMTLMEQEFKIPALHNQKWEQENKAIISLYRIISESRIL